ncbi:hypothetical protein [Lacticaseibacillus nasuensis]|uniref:Uncharacterized protein n=1 Tax=Lacticaseibacillus nasuensis JCM 17158 TaxID=1291734 RepID=A0A0R1JVL2_9LACO|nr:hypothetical protein [Lacticaseibacillus nasuensis]KRK71850.1 hypothetical protein FD02_GL002095 [Lacticaseibacillus nasuensis JCM 17158]
MTTTNEQAVTNGIFPMGAKNDAYAQYFVGQSYLNTLINDPAIDVTHDGIKLWHGATKNSWFVHIEHWGLVVNASEPLAA